MKNGICHWSKAGVEGVYGDHNSPYPTSRRLWQISH